MAGRTYRTGTWRLRARPACRFDTERTFAFSFPYGCAGGRVGDPAPRRGSTSRLKQIADRL